MSEQKFTPIREITDETVASIRRRTALSLPDDPQAAGMKGATVKRRFWEGMVGDGASLLEEQRRIVREANAAMEQLGESMDRSVEAARVAVQEAAEEYTNEVGAQIEQEIRQVDQTVVKAETDANAAREAANEAKTAVDAVPGMIVEAIGKGGLRGHAAGETVCVRDVSPITHTMKVKVSSDTVADLSAVKVRRFGKNLLNVDEDAINYDLTQHKNTMARVFVYNVPPGFYILTAYITKYADDTATNTRLYCKVMYKDGTSEAFESERDAENAERDGVQRRKHVKIRVDKGKDVDYLHIHLLDYSVITGFRSVRVDNAQLEWYTTPTDYEPYIEPTEHAVSADGVVEGVTSLYPSATLVSDTEGVVIEAEYMQDISKVFAELYGMVADLM